MNKITKTLMDLKGFSFVLTRLDPNLRNADDLDILVRENDFESVANNLVSLGYRRESHDQALGGRVEGAQANFVKKDRIKIDLHKDFTWRKKRYLDLDLVWSKKLLVDQFLVFINVIFEKTYIDKDDFNYIWKYKSEIFANEKFYIQARKYSWEKSFVSFKKWSPKINKFPVFLPLSIVLTSYFEKFDPVSLLYYFFFRIRYFFLKTLPYD